LPDPESKANTLSEFDRVIACVSDFSRRSEINAQVAVNMLASAKHYKIVADRVVGSNGAEKILQALHSDVKVDTSLFPDLLFEILERSTRELYPLALGRILRCQIAVKRQLFDLIGLFESVRQLESAFERYASDV
jgi:hypothetical protein